MSNQTILVIGSSGFLGRQITRILAPQENVIKTHCQNSLYPDSIRYDFFNDDIENLLDKQKVDVVIFAGMVETNPLEAVQVSMERFAKACRVKKGSSFLCSQTLSRPAHLPVTQTVSQ